MVWIFTEEEANGIFRMIWDAKKWKSKLSCIVIEYQDIVMNWSDYFITLMCIYREIGKSYSAGIQ